MNSFGDFLENKHISKEEQLARQQKTLEQLNKTKKKLAKDGLDTFDIDQQMRKVDAALVRRRSGTHSYYGTVVRFDQSTEGWRITTRDGRLFLLPYPDAHEIMKIPADWQSFKKPQPKFIEYRQEGERNIITHVENRTVDIVPFRTTDSKFYLIRRKDSGLWATVGGHIEEGENPLAAAQRELHEETGSYPLILRKIPYGWVRSVSALPSREHNSWTLPFIALMNPETVMKPQDDAIGGDWFDFIPDNLHFDHHKKIIRLAQQHLPSLLKEFGKH